MYHQYAKVIKEQARGATLRAENPYGQCDNEERANTTWQFISW